MSDASAPLAARLNYAQCWEDVRLLIEGFAVGPGDDVLSVASAGDNSIALALAGARSVTAVDLSLPQIALTELKLAARHLSLDDTRVLFGLESSGGRLPRYHRLREHLTEPSRRWWDEHLDLVERGILRSGRFERYLALFRTRVLPLVHRRSRVEAWFDLPDLAAQQRYYEDVWDNLRWRLLFRLFFSRRVMEARGRSPEQFAHVQGPVSLAFLERARRMFTTLPLRDNGYVQWMLLGRWVCREAVPEWITPAGHARLDEAAARITLVHASLQEHLTGAGVGAYSAFNLSDVFEYLSERQSADLFSALLPTARRGARLAYWNLLVPRERPLALADRVRPLREEASELGARDRAFVYGAFRLEEVL